ncbi:MAG: N-acetyl-gamma-glutamyl-phosphate reductase [Aquificaceae bacterium]|nr:N-acetyl-gamma-glutamyl-phosphate reductase [Aquificaceae bacterium]MCX8164391.1 N-acetyl-gamma-glutamyl-phosphate reductase [Aquificaceae bacterium]
MEQKIRVCIYGATGYTGAELLRLLQNHPFVKVVALTSQSYAGKKLSEVFPFLEATDFGRLVLLEDPEEDYDVAFLCLPHEISLNLVPKLLKSGKRVIDLSGAYRISTPSKYQEYYGFEHTNAELLKSAVYGLPEVFRKSVGMADLVANPGCYPTATLLALYPILKQSIPLEWVVVDAISGISGAGRKTVQKFHYPEMEGDSFAYAVEKHRHSPEIEDVIKRISGNEIKIRFTPQVVPMARGMMAKVYTRCEKRSYFELYREIYKEEPFVLICKEPPHVKHVRGTNYCLIYCYYDEKSSILEVISVIDNLGKGASSQALQNFNLMMGLEETLGLKQIAFYP